MIIFILSEIVLAFCVEEKNLFLAILLINYFAQNFTLESRYCSLSDSNLFGFSLPNDFPFFNYLIDKNQKKKFIKISFFL